MPACVVGAREPARDEPEKLIGPVGPMSRTLDEEIGGVELFVVIGLRPGIAVVHWLVLHTTHDKPRQHWFP